MSTAQVITLENLNPLTKETFAMFPEELFNGMIDVLNKIHQLEASFSQNEDGLKISSPMCFIIEAYVLQQSNGVPPDSIEQAEAIFYPIAEGLTMLEREVAA